MLALWGVTLIFVHPQMYSQEFRVWGFGAGLENIGPLKTWNHVLYQN